MNLQRLIWTNMTEKRATRIATSAAKKGPTMIEDAAAAGVQQPVMPALFIVTWGDCPTAMGGDGLFASMRRACVFRDRKAAEREVRRVRARAKRMFPGLKFRRLRIIELEPA